MIWIWNCNNIFTFSVPFIYQQILRVIYFSCITESWNTSDYRLLRNRLFELKCNFLFLLEKHGTLYEQDIKSSKYEWYCTIPILDYFYKRIFSHNEDISLYGNRVNTFSGTLHLIIEEKRESNEKSYDCQVWCIHR